MNTDKRKRLEKIMRRIVSRFITEELPDNENIFGLINISKVTLSSDKSYLDIKVSCFNNSEILTKVLAKYAYIVQRHIGKEVGMRVNPRVRFRYDNSGELGQTITAEINKLDIENLEAKCNK